MKRRYKSCVAGLVVGTIVGIVTLLVPPPEPYEIPGIVMAVLIAIMVVFWIGFEKLFGFTEETSTNTHIFLFTLCASATAAHLIPLLITAWQLRNFTMRDHGSLILTFLCCAFGAWSDLSPKKNGNHSLGRSLL